MPGTAEERRQRALKKPKTETGGNTKPDAAWLAAVADQLHDPIEAERPPQFLYQVNYQWEGYLDELNLEFFESFRRNWKEPRKCNGTAYVRDQTGMYVVDAEWNRLVRPCLAQAARGTTVCHAHGAKIPQVKAAAERALAEASEVVALRLIGMTDKSTEDEKVRLAAMNSVLDRAGIKGGVSIEVTTPGYQKVLEKMFGAEPEDDDE